MIPKYWGEHGWIFLHTITTKYPNKPTAIEKENYYTFFLLLQYVLPCGNCSNHYSENLKIIPLDENALSSRMNLMIWLIKLHNLVNKQTNKSILTINQALSSISKNSVTWEKSAWIFLHSIAIEYPLKQTETLENRDPSKMVDLRDPLVLNKSTVLRDLDKEKYKSFFTTLQYVFPCLEYRKYYTQSLLIFPIKDEVMESQTMFFDWLNEIHNNINILTNRNTCDSKTRALRIIIDQNKVQKYNELKTNIGLRKSYESLANHSKNSTNFNHSNSNSYIIIMIVIILMFIFMMFFFTHLSNE